MRSAFLVILILGYSTILTGCWDYHEINDLAFVAGVALDKSSNGKGYLFTAEIVSSAGKEGKIQSKLIQAEGISIYDASRNLIRLSGKRISGKQQVIVIISQDVAREGVLMYIDILQRLYETRLATHILISKEKTAKELLSQQSITTEIRSMEMKAMVNSDKAFLGKSPHVDVRNFINMLSEEGQAPVLAAVGITASEGSMTSELSGIAIFKGDKLVGFLDGEDTKFFLFIRNQIKDTTLVLNENTDSAYKGTTLEIYKSKTRVKPVNLNGKLLINIDINVVAGLNELSVTKNLIDEKGRIVLKKEAEKTLKLNVENVINKIKEEYGLDIFGFGAAIKRDMPSLWKTAASNWDKEFRSLKVNVKTNIEIRESGLSSKPIKVGKQ